MDHPMVMGVLKGLSGLAGDADRILYRELMLPPKPVPK
jgi:hypothetical protein